MADTEKRLNAELYEALAKGEDAKVSKICEKFQEGPFHKVTIQDDTVLHIATRHKRNDLVLELLRQVPESHSHKLISQNSGGHTILHDTALNNGTVPAAKAMLLRDPQLLTIRNKRGETALFRAARHGKTSIFTFLDDQLKLIFRDPTEADLRTFHIRNDKSTILHVSILSENFRLAREIAEKYSYLVGEVDGDEMTALQLLACTPSAFHSGITNSFFKRLLLVQMSKKRYRVPLLKQIAKQKHRCESAKTLATILVRCDTSWEATASRVNKSKVKVHGYGSPSTARNEENITSTKVEDKEMISKVRHPETPLFLATKSGCIDIVKGILKVYPQAVEHVDEDGRNILHLAIMYRRNQVFETLVKKKHILRRLKGKNDNEGNSILHMVGLKVEDRDNEAIRSPALVLRDDLHLYERVERICSTLTTLQLNSEGKTATQMFAENHAKLRMEAKEWMKRTAASCSIVAVLIATVAFAAAYTVPGGPDQDTGYPLLRKQPLFLLFTMADTVSLALALTSVIIYLSILSSPFRFKDFKRSLPQKLLLGLTVLILSVSMMMVAFAATVILMVRSNQEWTEIALYSVAFFPVTIFIISYVKLYKSLVSNFRQSLMRKIEALIPPREEEPSKKGAIQYSGPTQYPTTTSVEIYEDDTIVRELAIFTS